VESRQGKLQSFLQLALVGLLAGAAHAQDAPASGTLTINGSRVALKYAYASAEPAFFDKNGEDIRIRLSDVELSEEAATDVFAIVRLAREGAARVVEVTIDAKGEPMSGAIYAREFNGMVSLAGMHKFAPTRLERKVVAGRLWIEGLRTFSNVTFGYDATFSAAIPRPPTEEERAAALATPPARLVETYLATLRAGQLAAFMDTLSKNAAADYAGPTGEARFKKLQADMPADAKPATVTKMRDGSVQVSVEGQQNGITIEYLLRVVMEGGSWKIGK
jgi:hypothetical protein